MPKIYFAASFKDETQEISPDDIMIKNDEGTIIEDPNILLNSLKKIYLQITPSTPITLQIIFRDETLGEPYSMTVSENMQIETLLDRIANKYHTDKLFAYYLVNDKFKFYKKNETVKAVANHDFQVYIGLKTPLGVPSIRKIEPTKNFRCTIATPQISGIKTRDVDMNQAC